MPENCLTLPKELGAMQYTNISKYERDKSEPPLTVLLAYARAVGVRLEQIVDDDADLTLGC